MREFHECFKLLPSLILELCCKSEENSEEDKVLKIKELTEKIGKQLKKENYECLAMTVTRSIILKKEYYLNLLIVIN